MPRKLRRLTWWNKPRLLDMSVGAWFTLVVACWVAVKVMDFINKGGLNVWPFN